jgi:hypothetical protein
VGFACCRADNVDRSVWNWESPAIDNMTADGAALSEERRESNQRKEDRNRK